MQILLVFLFFGIWEKILQNINFYISPITRDEDMKIKDNIRQLIKD
jgi:hypothetical protein